jgi:hypothetical protein
MNYITNVVSGVFEESFKFIIGLVLLTVVGVGIAFASFYSIYAVGAYGIGLALLAKTEFFRDFFAKFFTYQPLGWFGFAVAHAFGFVLAMFIL